MLFRSCHHSQSPQMSQSIPGKPVFPAMPRLSSRGSTQTVETPWTVAHQTPLSMGFSGQEHWSGLPQQHPAEKLGQPCACLPGRTSLQQDGLRVHPSSDSILLLTVPPDHLLEDLRTWCRWGDRATAVSATCPPAGPCDKPASP